MTKLITQDFYIYHFDDNHEIYDMLGFKSLELGCYPVEEYGYCRYFGLFYKERIPSFNKILESIKDQVCIDNISHYKTQRDISISKYDLIYELKLRLK